MRSTCENLFSQVRIWDTQAKKAYPVTDPAYSSSWPAWDPKGKYLYFLSDRAINPFLDIAEARFVVRDATLPCRAGPPGRRRPALRAPWRRGSREARGEEGREGRRGEGGDRHEDGRGQGRGEGRAIRIDFEGLADRVVPVPVAPGTTASSGRVDGQAPLAEGDRPRHDALGRRGGGESRGRELLTYDFDKEKLATLASGVQGYEVSMDGKVLVYRTKDGFTRVEAGAAEAPKDDAAKEAKVDLSGWALSVVPRDEWKQMLREAWRLQRDFFYDPKMHGVDWEGVWKQYGSLADRISSRDDLADMLGEMFGELNVGHAYQGGGDVRRGKPVGTGLLAADLEQDPASGFWQIRKIHRGDFPEPEGSSPLARPDLRIKPGQWLVAIDGQPAREGRGLPGAPGQPRRARRSSCRSPTRRRFWARGGWW